MRLCVIQDFLEEGWPSMELTASMLVSGLAQRSEFGVSAEAFRPRFLRLATRIPGLGGRRPALNADRLLNRRWVYPRAVARIRDRFETFHVSDHTYAHLVHALPAERTGVYCHDLDAFRCVLEPAREPRPAWFRAMAASALDGLRRAALVFHNSMAVRRQILEHALVPADRLVHAPFGAAAEFTGDGVAAREEHPFLLHVGSCVERKRLDVLVDVFAAARARFPTLRLVQVGGTWTPAIRARIERLGLGSAVRQERGLPRERLAALYRGATLVLQPSDAEGFGLPVLEALACGASVVASDIPALREVGGDGVSYCPPGDVAAWADTVVRLLSSPSDAPPRETRLAQAARSSIVRHAEIIARSYLALPHARVPGPWA